MQSRRQPKIPVAGDGANNKKKQTNTDEPGKPREPRMQPDPSRYPDDWTPAEHLGDGVFAFDTENGRRRVTRDIVGRMILLGTGTSHGVPVIGCACPVCLSDDPRDRRTRASAIVGLPQGNLLIDTTPDLRTQLLRESIGLVHAVAYTHGHADHLMGLDDLRIFARYLGHDLPIYCTEEVEERIRRTFDYAFDPVTRAFPAGGVPRLVFRRIEPDQPIEILGAQVLPVTLEHGKIRAIGYRIGRVAYCTDAHNIPPSSMRLLEDLDTLILDALRFERHLTHFSIDEALEFIAELKPTQAYLTHIAHAVGHARASADLPKNVDFAHDGLTLPLQS